MVIGRDNDGSVFIDLCLSFCEWLFFLVDDDDGDGIHTKPFNDEHRKGSDGKETVNLPVPILLVTIKMAGCLLACWHTTQTVGEWM